MTDAGLMSIHELLEDEKYAKFFETNPILPDHYYNDGQRPWRLMVLIKDETKWRSKRYETYDEALEQIQKIMPRIANGAINSPGLNFMPPIRHAKVKNRVHPKTRRPLIISRVWMPLIDGDTPPHHWCGYCRRPTIFGHKAMRARMMNGFQSDVSEVAYRCLLCGSRASLMDIRKPQNNQQWDINRPRFYNG